MWELRNKLSHGRISVRRFSLATITILVAFFTISSLFTATAHADEPVKRDGDNVVYQNNTYTPASKSDIPSDVLKDVPDTTGYRYVDTDAKKAYFILTSGDESKATSGYYVVYTYTPPSNYSDPSPPATVSIASSDGSTDGNSSDAPSCDGSTLGGIGWIVCPTVNFIAKGMDKIYGVVSDFLEVKTVTNDTTKPIYQLWSVIRDIANVCFVIAFIIVVYSQITGMGLNNYSLKRILPRLVVAAILVNISFWVCAIAVDVSNLLGYSIHSLFTGLMDKFSVGSNYTGTIPSWEQVSAIALSGTAAAAGGIFVAANGIAGSVYLLIPFLVTVVIAALVALIVLAARQAIITIMVIVSPLAFVAYILPNTEKYFGKWRELMMTMLLLFPIFSVLFSGAQVAGMAIIQSAGGNLFTIILGMAVQVAPIVMTPMLVKFSGSLIGKIAGIVNNPNRGLIDRTRKWSQGKAAEHKSKILADQGRYFKRNPLNKATKALDTHRRTVEGRRKAYESMANNRFEDTEQGHNIEAMNRSASNEKQRIENVFANSQLGRDLDLQSRHLGTEKQEIENDLMRSSAGQAHTYRQHIADADKIRVGNEFEETELGDKAEHAKRVVDAEKRRIDNTHQAEWDESLRTDAKLNHLELSVKASEIKASLEKGKLEKMHAEIAAVGDPTKGTSAQQAEKAAYLREHVQNLRGNNPALNDGILNIARNIHDQQTVSAVTNTAKVMAEHELSSTVNSTLLNNKAVIDGKKIQEYAAGIGNVDNVLANSVATERKDFGEQVSHQKELASHFKLSAENIAKLAKGVQDVTVEDGDGNSHTFSRNDPYVRDMVAEQIFKVGSHGDIIDVIKTTGMVNGVKGINYDYRRTIMDAAISSGFAAKNPAIADKTLDAINNGNFSGDESLQYHSLREVLEGRIKSSALASANAASLRMLFAKVGGKNADPLAQSQFNQLVNDIVASAVKNDPSIDADALRAEKIKEFHNQRKNMRDMAQQVLKSPTVRQGTNAESVKILEDFRDSFGGPAHNDK